MNLNRILEPAACKSDNFFNSDIILQHFIKTFYSKAGFSFMKNRLEKLGADAATKMDKLSQLADKNPPVLQKRNAFGEDINEIEFHPAYESLKQIAVESAMFQVKWDADLYQKFKSERHALSFGAGYLFAMVECGLFCPLCMTDGVARIISRFGGKEDQQRLLPQIATLQAEELYTGAMFLTEKAGGSDVGANLVSAKAVGDGYYKLNGEKWFCSNANAELILALARTNPEITGTKGLSIFLIEKELPDGLPNHKNIVRLKDKIGVRSMASAEIILEDTVGKLIGKEGQGFYIMAEMINLSRLYNSVAASASIRRVLIEAFQYLSYRKTFGKITLEHVYFTWHTILTLDKADNGDKNAQQLIRLLTPMLKKSTAEGAVYVCREAMEAIGGIAYIEESVIPKFLRDALVLPIWEGAGNIMVLDMLRAAFKENALPVFLNELKTILQRTKDDFLTDVFENLTDKIDALRSLPQDALKVKAKYFFEDLTHLYQIALLYFYKDETSMVWIDGAIEYLKQHYFDAFNDNIIFSRDDVERMIAWEY